MVDLAKQIKELEKRAKDAEYWKDRYEALFKEVEATSKRLASLAGLPLKRLSVSDEMQEVIKKAYQQMKEDTQLSTADMEKMLSEASIKAHSGNLNKMRQELIRMKGISTRKEGKNIILYYDDNNPTPEAQKEQAIKMGKVSVMG